MIHSPRETDLAAAKLLVTWEGNGSHGTRPTRRAHFAARDRQAEVWAAELQHRRFELARLEARILEAPQETPGAPGSPEPEEPLVPIVAGGAVTARRFSRCGLWRQSKWIARGRNPSSSPSQW
jgi:hypothetical protein